MQAVYIIQIFEKKFYAPRVKIFGTCMRSYLRGSSQLIMDIFNNLSTVSGILKIIACS